MTVLTNVKPIIINMILLIKMVNYLKHVRTAHTVSTANVTLL